MQIAVIDDEPVSLAVLSGLVAKVATKCQVHEFRSASAAVGWCSNHEPDLIIVDYMMPAMDGIEFTRQLRGLSAGRQTPVVMVSAVVDRNLIRRALEQGVDDFLHKPFDCVELRTCVSNVLGLRAMQDQLANKALLMKRDPSHMTACRGCALRNFWISR